MQGQCMPDFVATIARFLTESPVTVIMLQSTLKSIKYK